MRFSALIPKIIQIPHPFLPLFLQGSGKLAGHSSCHTRSTVHMSVHPLSHRSLSCAWSNSNEFVCSQESVLITLTHHKIGWGEEIRLRSCKWQMEDVEEESRSSDFKCKDFWPTCGRGGWGWPTGPECLTTGLSYSLPPTQGQSIPRSPWIQGLQRFALHLANYVACLACIIPQHAMGLKDRCWDPYLSKYL